MNDWGLGASEDDDLFGEDVYKLSPGEVVNKGPAPTLAQLRGGVHWFDYLNPRYWLDHRGWVADNLIDPSHRAAYLAAHGEDAFGAREAGPIDAFKQWAWATPGFIPWAQQQEDAFTGWLEDGMPSHPYTRQYEIRLTSHWPAARPYLDAVLATQTGDRLIGS